MEYTVGPDSRAANHLVRELAFPDVAVVAMVTREQHVIPPRGTTRILPGDHVFIVLRPDVRSLVDRVFGRGGEADRAVPERFEFPLRGSTTVEELEEFYGIRIEVPGEKTLSEVLQERLGDRMATPGSQTEFGEIVLIVREFSEGKVDQVGLAITPPPEGAADSAAEGEEKGAEEEEES